MPRRSASSYSKEWEDTQKTRFDRILKRDTSQLLRESSEEFNFLEIKTQVLYVIEQVKILSQNYEFWSQLSENKRVQLNTSLEDIVTIFDSLESFDPKQNGAWDLRNSLIIDFKNRYNAFYINVIEALSAYLGKRAYSEELSSKFGQEAEKELDEIRRVRKDIEKVQLDLKNAATVAGSGASSAHGKAFFDESVTHLKMADNWLKAVIASSALVLLLSLTVVYDIVKELGNDKFGANAEAYIFKLALLAFLYVILRFVTKNYSIHRHLNVINKHRANVLNSMEAFRTSAIGESPKDTILLSAVGAAYALQETGYITTKEGAGSDDGDILDVVKSAVNK
jgi:hypothetical protein